MSHGIRWGAKVVDKCLWSFLMISRTETKSSPVGPTMQLECMTLHRDKQPRLPNTMRQLSVYGGSTRLKAGFWLREVGIRLWRYVFVYGDRTFISALTFSLIWILIVECYSFVDYLVLGSTNAKPCFNGSVAWEVLYDGCRVPAYGCWNCREAYSDFQPY